MWEALEDFSHEVSDTNTNADGTKVTVRLSKSNDSYKPKYTVALGVLTHEGFRPYLRADLLDMSKSVMGAIPELFHKAKEKMV